MLLRSTLGLIGLFTLGVSAVDPVYKEHMELFKRADDCAGVDVISAISVLMTALPPSILSLEMTNTLAASYAIELEFATGFPKWYSDLPSCVKSYVATAFETTAGPQTTTVVKTTRAGDSSTLTTITSKPNPNTAVTTTGLPQPTEPASGGLSTGAKIGLGVGIPLAVLALGGLIAAIWFFGVRKGKQSNNTGSPDQAMAQQQFPPPQQPGYPPQQQQYQQPPQAYAQQPYQPAYNQQQYVQQPAYQANQIPYDQKDAQGFVAPVAPASPGSPAEIPPPHIAEMPATQK